MLVGDEPDAPLRRHRRIRRKRGPQLWAVTSTVLLIALSVFAFFAIVVPFVLGAQTYTVLTGSMRPTMPPGTLIGTKPTDIEHVKIGDIITYQIESGDPAVITHRVISLARSGDGDTILHTQGDDNSVADENPVIGEQVRGVVVYSVPYLGYPASLVTGETRSLFVIVLGLAVIAYGAQSLLRDLLRSLRSRRPRSVDRNAEA